MQLIAGLFLPLLMLFHLVGPVPGDLGVHNGQLSPCPSPAHCASRSWNPADPQADFETLAEAAADLPRSVVVERDDGYLHAQVSSALFGFVDDLELLLLKEGQEVQARSISRLGDSDLGVNARRLMELDAALEG
jgi:uncharacterized protein (DUF1499 family)